MIKRKLQRWVANDWVQVILTFFAISLVRFFPVFFLGKTLYFGDNYSLLVPGKIFTAYWLKQGIVPLWNPSIFSGISWIGDITQSIFYPSSLYFLMFPNGIALSVTVLSHLFITMVGMYLLAKTFSRSHWTALLVSGLWMLSSQVTGSANNLATLQSITWLPWVLYTATLLNSNRYGFIWLSLAIFFNVLAGYPQHILLIVPIAAIFSLVVNWVDTSKKINWWEWLKQWFLTGVLSLGLSSFVLWPFVETLITSTRMDQSVMQASLGSMHPAELIKMVIPYFFDVPVFGLRWGPSWNTFPTAFPYVTWFGLVALALSLPRLFKEKSGRPLLLLGAVTVVLAMGGFVPGFHWLLTHIPGLSTMRSASTWLLISNISFLVLLAVVLPKIRIPTKFSKIARPLLAVIILSSVSGLLLVWFQFDWVWSVLNSLTGQALSSSLFHTPERDSLILLAIGANVLLNAVFALAALISFNRKKFALLVSVLLLDGIVNSQALLFFAPNHLYDTPQNQEIVQLLQDSSNRSLTRNFNNSYTDYGSYWEALVVRAPFSDSFVDQQELQTADHLKRLRDGLTPDWNMPAQVPVVNGYTTMIPTSYQRQWESPDEARINALSEIPLDHPQLQNWAVKYYVVDTWFEIKEELPQTEPIYNQGHWQVYELPTLSRFRYANDEAVVFTQFKETPNEITFSFNNQTDQTYLKIADRYETGWQAQVNEQQVRVENWDDLRAIPIAQGENTVTVRYLPQSLIRGGIISLATLVLLLAYVSVNVVKSRRQHKTSSKPKKKKN